MKFFLDTANIEELKKAKDLGLLDGVTTNPSLVAKEGKDHTSLIKEICELVGEGKAVSSQVLSTDAKGMFEEGKKLAKIHKNVVVKVPLIAEGLKAVKMFTKEGIKTNVTLCFSSTQALLAAKAGASFVSVFCGRLDDHSYDGVGVAGDCHEILQNYPDLSSEVLAASIRHPLHVLELMQIGIPAVTLPYKVFETLLQVNPLTEIGLEKFLKDAKKI